MSESQSASTEIPPRSSFQNKSNKSPVLNLNDLIQDRGHQVKLASDVNQMLKDYSKVLVDATFSMFEFHRFWNYFYEDNRH